MIVDVSIDQGGCVETAHPTSHSDPVYPVHGVIHYCVTNMPGAYPRTATVALTQATLPYLKTLAAGGRAALLENPELACGVNTLDGYLTCEASAGAWADEPLPALAIGHPDTQATPWATARRADESGCVPSAVQPAQPEPSRIGNQFGCKLDRIAQQPVSQ